MASILQKSTKTNAVSKKAFTLIELIVVIALISVFTGIILMSTGSNDGLIAKTERERLLEDFHFLKQQSLQNQSTSGEMIFTGGSIGYTTTTLENNYLDLTSCIPNYTTNNIDCIFPITIPKNTTGTFSLFVRNFKNDIKSEINDATIPNIPTPIKNLVSTATAPLVKIVTINIPFNDDFYKLFPLTFYLQDESNFKYKSNEVTFNVFHKNNLNPLSTDDITLRKITATSATGVTSEPTTCAISYNDFGKIDMTKCGTDLKSVTLNFSQPPTHDNVISDLIISNEL